MKSKEGEKKRKMNRDVISCEAIVNNITNILSGVLDE